LLIVPDLGYAFGPARMGMRPAIGGVNEDRSHMQSPDGP
jgi:hypothetical protein